LANTYGVSEETVLRRLLTLGRTTPTFYARKRAEYLARYERIEDHEREAANQGEFKRNRPQEVISDFGRYFTRLVLANYSQDRISLNLTHRRFQIPRRQGAHGREGRTTAFGALVTSPIYSFDKVSRVLARTEA